MGNADGEARAETACARNVCTVVGTQRREAAGRRGAALFADSEQLRSQSCADARRRAARDLRVRYNVAVVGLVPARVGDGALSIPQGGPRDHSFAEIPPQHTDDIPA